MGEISILHEDDVLLVINKPAGIVVNNATTVKGETVQDWAYKHLSITPPAEYVPAEVKEDGTVIRDIPAEFAARAGIVHRIDKETSGCLLIAKSPDIFDKLQQQFKERIVHKKYLAVVHGKLVPLIGEIRAPVGRLPWNREQFGIVPGGKDAVTSYEVKDSGQSPDGETISLVELAPETGRTHQIRVHLKYIHHPIVGDYLYAGRKTARADRLWAPRVMLHAWKLSFVHPVSGKTLAFETPMPDDMKSIVQWTQAVYHS